MYISVFTDMFMIVMTVIGTAALISQMCIMRLVMRHKKRLPPPLWVDNLHTRWSHNKTRDKYKDLTCHEMTALHKENGRDNVMNKWIEEKELMLEEQTLGLTTLGRDAGVSRHQNKHVTHARDQYVTLPRDSSLKNNSCKNDRYKTSQRVTLNNRITTVHFQSNSNSQNGNSQETVNNQPPGKVSQTYYLADAPGGFDEGSRDSRASEADSGCHSEIKNSPDVTMATHHCMKHAQFKKCIICFDRTVSLVISAAVMFTVIIFIVIYLAA